MRIVFETPQTLCLEPSSSVSDGCGQTVQRRVEPLKVFRFRNGATPYGFVTSPFQSGKEERGAMPCLHHTVPISGISSRRIRCSTRLRKAKKSRRRNSLKKKTCAISLTSTSQEWLSLPSAPANAMASVYFLSQIVPLLPGLVAISAPTP